MNRDDRTPVEELVRAYQGAPADRARALAQALQGALHAQEVALQAGAIRFFAAVEDAPDDGALAAALRDQAPRYDGVPDPWVPEGGEDLRTQLARAVAARCQPGDPATLTLLQREALLPGRAGAVIAALFDLALPFVEAHAAQIVTGSPVALAAALYHLQRRQRPVLPLVEALVGKIPRAELRAAVQAELRPPDLQAALARLARLP